MIFSRKRPSEIWVYFIIEAPAFIRKRLWSRYLSPDAAFTPPALSRDGQELLDELKRDGIVKASRMFPGLARYVRETVPG